MHLHLNISRVSLLATLLLPFVYANTEIINFSAPQAPTTLLSTNWPVLSKLLAKGAFNITGAPYGVPLHEACQSALQAKRTTKDVCIHELWLVLDLSDRKWASFSKFTLRASWPASFPADIDMKLYDSDTLTGSFSGTPPPSAGGLEVRRHAYARIGVRNAGVLTPGYTPRDFAIPPVPVFLILEPLYLGVLPASVVPTVAFIIAVVVLCALGFPRIHGFIAQAAQQAREEAALEYKND